MLAVAALQGPEHGTSSSANNTRTVDLLVGMALIFQKLRSRVDLLFAFVLMSEYRNMKEVCSYHLGPKLRTFQTGVFLR
jgi:hypothetical protein